MSNEHVRKVSNILHEAVQQVINIYSMWCFICDFRDHLGRTACQDTLGSVERL